MDGPETVGAGIAAADDDDALAFRRDDLLFRHLVLSAAAVLLSEVVHGEVNAGEVAPGHGKVARS